MRKKKNVYLYLRDREYGMTNYYRSNLLILRELIVDRNNDFKPFWETVAKECLHVDNFHVFVNSMQRCYSLNTCSTPILLYNIEEQIKAYGSVTSYITSRGSIENMMSYDPDARSQFTIFAVTKKNYLLHLNIATGKLIHALLLSKDRYFREIFWDVPEERFYVSSTKHKSQHRPFMTLQIFSVWPFTYHGQFEIYNSYFGERISDVMLTNYMLMISYETSHVRFFSFPFSETRSADTLLLYNVSSEKMKSMELLSLRIELKNSCCQLLLDIVAPFSILSIGGNPYHYITSHKSCRHLWEIKSLETNTKCHRGFIGSDKLQLEPEQCFFHPDNSGKIVILGGEHVTVFSINSNKFDVKLMECTLKELFTIKAENSHSSMPRITHTSSGRAIKQRITNDYLNYNVIQCLSFEDELDFVIVTSIDKDSITANWHGVVHIHDDQTGRLLKSYKLKEIWNPDDTHSVEMDLDTLYHFTKTSKGKFALYVHKLRIV